MEEYQSVVAESEGTGCENSEAEDISPPPDRAVTVSRRKNSFVWKYFRQIGSDKKSYECIICNGTVGCQTTSNLARHLETNHNILKPIEAGVERTVRGRPSRSFIWKYCSKEDSKHARCHLCQKILYFGGGNTANINKHLRRRHLDQIENMDGTVDDVETAEAAATLMKVETLNGEEHSGGGKFNSNGSLNQSHTSTGRRERKGGSYVWNYCDKLSRHTVRCKLCTKLMSFHGTANVITHLQRRHNILGKLDCVNNRTGTLENGNTVETGISEVGEPEEQLDADGGQGDEMGDYGYAKRPRRSLGSTSVVWKYCKRISSDVVRCSFCTKNLSYQGTSNLQRHLHRMHGIVTQGRIPKESTLSEQEYTQLSNSNFVWEHCTLLDGDQVKCNMCSAVFDSKLMGDISKHLTMIHAVESRRASKRQTRRRVEFTEETSDSDDKDDFGDNWSKLDESEDAPPIEMNIKKDETLYDDIIEEDPEHNNCDEDPFDPNMLHEIPMANPLSAVSSHAGSPELERKVLPKHALHNNKLQKLNEDRVRMETEYFREKAGFYRMQKYLTALQAKKVRIEMERMTSTTELSGATYDVTVEGQHNLQNLPTQ